MSDIDVLESVVAKNVRLLENVTPDQLGKPTPCTEYDVKALTNHLAGWGRVIADGANDVESTVDGGSYTSEDPAGDYAKAADDLVNGWREGGMDRDVRFGTMAMPAAMTLSMTLMEEVTHGCDLALATGQPVPFTDAELETTLERAKATLPDDMRGNAFAPRIDVPDDAPALDRLLGFMGRRRS